MLYYVSGDRHSLHNLDDAKSECLALSEDRHQNQSIYLENGKLMYTSFYSEDEMCWKLRKV